MQDTERSAILVLSFYHISWRGTVPVGFSALSGEHALAHRPAERLMDLPRSKYQDIYRDLRQKILAGTYSGTGLLPSEHELIETYDCSRNTVRRAIADLVEEGYVQTLQGKRVQVLSSPQTSAHFSVGGIESFREAAERNGMQHTETRVLSFEEDELGEEEARESGFPEGSRVYRIKRVRCIDGMPLILDINLFLCSETKGLTPEIAETSVYDYLESELKMQITTSRRVITACPATPEDRRYLNLGKDGFVCIVTSQTFNGDGVQFEYTQSRHHPEYFCFEDTATRRK